MTEVAPPLIDAPTSELRFIDLRAAQVCRQCKKLFCMTHRYAHECDENAAEANVSSQCSYQGCSNFETNRPLCASKMLVSINSIAQKPESRRTDSKDTAVMEEQYINDVAEITQDVINTDGQRMTLIDLPSELLAGIFDHCDFATTQTARLVCRKFYNVLQRFHFIGPSIKYITIRGAGLKDIEVIFPRTNREFRASEVCDSEDAVAKLVNKLFKKVTEVSTLKFERIEFSKEFFQTINKGFLKHVRNGKSLLFYSCSIGVSIGELTQLISKMNPTSMEFERCIFSEEILCDKIFHNCSHHISLSAWPDSNHFPRITDVTLDDIAKVIPPMIKFEDVRTGFSLQRLLKLLREAIGNNQELQWEFGLLTNENANFDVEAAVKEICSNFKDVLWTGRENEFDNNYTDYTVFTYTARSIHIKFSVRQIIPENQADEA